MVERFADVGRRLTPAVAVVPQGYGLRDNNHVSTRGADAYVDASTFSLTRPIDGRASDPEQVGELSGAVLTTFEESHQVRFLPMIQLGLLAAQAPLGLGDLHPFPGTQPNQIRLENFAAIASTLNSNLPTGSVGSYTDPPRLRRTCRTVSSSAMALASGKDRASRSSLVTTNVSPSQQAARASRRPGRSRLVPVRP